MTISPSCTGLRKCSRSIDAVTTAPPEWRADAMPPAMSIHCMRMPPKIVPCVLVRPGNTICAVSTREARGVFRTARLCARGVFNGARGFSIAKACTDGGNTAAARGSTRAAKRLVERSRVYSLGPMRFSTPSGSRHSRWTTVLSALATLGLLAVAPTAHAKKLTLPQLLDLARAASPGIQATGAAAAAMEAQVSEARRNWLPQGDLLSVLAPSPQVQ